MSRTSRAVAGLAAVSLVVIVILLLRGAARPSKDVANAGAGAPGRGAAGLVAAAATAVDGEAGLPPGTKLLRPRPSFVAAPGLQPREIVVDPTIAPRARTILLRRSSR